MDNILQFPMQSIEQQLTKLAGSEKVMLAYYDEEGNLHTFLGEALTHMEMVYLVDTLRSRSDSIFNG